MKQRILLYFAIAAPILAVGVVVLGAFTRLVDAGLGCPDWPTCYGHLWVPNTEGEIHQANQLFTDTPVETGKTWPEQTHRIFATHLGLVALIIFGLALSLKEKTHPWKSIVGLLACLVGGTIVRIFVGDSVDPYLWGLCVMYFINLLYISTREGVAEFPFKLPAFIAGLVVLQGLFGMWTVTLKLWPQVVTAHLLGGFATLSLLWLMVLRLRAKPWVLHSSSRGNFLKLRGLSITVLMVVIAQIALGGWISSNYAALACPDFPLCQNQWLPPADFIQGFNLFQTLGPNYLGGLLDSDARTAIHLSHRIGAVVVTGFILMFAFKLWQTKADKARNIAVILLFALCLQVALGISNVVFALPLSVAVAHNAVGALLLLVVVTIHYQIRSAKYTALD